MRNARNAARAACDLQAHPVRKAGNENLAQWSSSILLEDPKVIPVACFKSPPESERRKPDFCGQQHCDELPKYMIGRLKLRDNHDRGASAVTRGGDGW